MNAIYVTACMIVVLFSGLILYWGIGGIVRAFRWKGWMREMIIRERLKHDGVFILLAVIFGILALAYLVEVAVGRAPQ